MNARSDGPAAHRTPKFIYFDLGNVLLHFDHRRAARQIAELVQAHAPGAIHAADPAAEVWKTIIDSRLYLQYEQGLVDGQGFHAAFCNAIGGTVPLHPFLYAWSDIFWPNVGIQPLVAHLQLAGHRLGILSNTSAAHWRQVSSGRYGLIPQVFEKLALSFELRAIKPEPEIFGLAARLAEAKPAEIFYIDDMPANVEAAQAAGFDAVAYVTVAELAADLRRRGVESNY